MGSFSGLVWVDPADADAVHKLDAGPDKSKSYKKYSILAQIMKPKFVDAPARSRPTSARFLIGAIGAASVGKTSAMYYYTEGKWIAEIPLTIGSDFRSKFVLDEPTGEILQLAFVDTAGQERFRSITRSFYRILHGCFVAFAINSRPSFDEVDMWMAELKQHNPAIPVILVGLKADLAPSERVVSTSEAEAKAAHWNVPYIEASSKDGTNVKRVYNILLRKAWQNRIATAQDQPGTAAPAQQNPPKTLFGSFWTTIRGFFSS
eukprot:TRINITY_DN608_c0_g1_i1.p1 TRINITY_DN608_c0_g1~~TRINITY_DN608_c0_g1_i1.p1  ORF type:complete len:262 (+),score=23.92 TRINITY_DN608_c0_g1_i1:374-1159(+)